MSRERGELGRWLGRGLGVAFLGLLLGCGGGKPEPEAAPERRVPILEQPNVIVFCADSLRADHLGCHGYESPTSPTIDALAAKGCVFSRCYAQAPRTRPAVASLMTGYTPCVHMAGVVRGEADEMVKWQVQVLGDDFVTLAEAFKGGGYATAMFSGAGAGQGGSGLEQGFDSYDYQQRADSEAQVGQALEWLEENRATPFFLMVQTRGPHHAYDPPDWCLDDLPFETGSVGAEERATAERLSRDVEFIEESGGVGALKPYMELSPEAASYLQWLYDAEIRYVDAQLRRLLEGVRELGLGEKTIVVVTSAHGEEFLEHGRLGHGVSLYDEVLRVPLIFSIPGNGEQVLVGESVRAFDLYPSLTTLCGIAPPAGLEAESLFCPDGMIAVGENRPVFSQCAYDVPQLYNWSFGLIVEPHKLIINRKWKHTQLYDRMADPGEWRSFWRVPGGVVDAMQDAMASHMKAARALVMEHGSSKYREFECEVPNKLRAAEPDPEEAAMPGRWRAFRGPRETAEEREELARTLEQIVDIGYLDGSTAAPELSGVTVHDKGRAWQGWNLYSSGHAPKAYLMDMDGRIFHTWGCSFAKVWSGREPPWQRGAEHWRRVRLFPNGDLLAIYEGNGLVKIDKDSKVVWSYGEKCHHDLEVQEDGRIYVLTRENLMGHWLRPAGPLYEDFVVILDPDGKELRTVSLLECLENSVYEPMLSNLPLWLPDAGDAFHTNTIEVLDGRLASVHGAFRRGNVLVSFHQLDAIAVVDLKKREVVWALTGMWRKQHQPTVLPSGQMLIFDNLGFGNWSRVLEFNPFTQGVNWCYAGQPPSEFFSLTCGSCQRLPNGNTLITESDNGRAFEVMLDQQVVWEFISPHRAGEHDEFIATLFEVIRLDPGFPVEWARGIRSD